jgi:arylsulfatase
MDRLHDEGVRFTDFHVSPTCAPTRAALLTGRHEFKNGVTHTILERERLALDATTLAQVLKTAGYATGIFGKWHLGDEPDHWPSERGFDEMFIHGAGGIGQTFPGSCGDAPGNTYFAPVILHNGTFVRTQGYCTDIFFSRAIEWMDDQIDAHIPFFAYIATNTPHEPLQVPAAEEARVHRQGTA